MIYIHVYNLESNLLDLFLPNLFAQLKLLQAIELTLEEEEEEEEVCKAFQLHKKDSHPEKKVTKWRYVCIKKGDLLNY